MHNDIVNIIYSEADLEERVQQLADCITADYAGKSPLLVSVLKGSYIFMADLTRSINLPLTVDFMVVSSYGKGVKTSGAVKIVKDLDIDITGLDIILVEDILDSGLTLNYLKNFLDSRGARSIKICTLLDKPERRTADIRADYIGFTIPDQFIVGYGLDFAEKYRNLPYIGVLKPELYINIKEKAVGKEY